MGVEYEWKFRADPKSQEVILAAYGDGWQQIAMETTYYDTPGGDLAKLRYTLRRRMENGKSVCTVKTPADHGGRGEWETEESTIERAIPKLCKLGGPETLQQLAENGLQAICGARFTRKARAIDIGAAVVELALDQGILLGGGREISLCEMEIELKEGSLEAAAAYAEHLAKKYGLVPEQKSKFRRALDLTKEN